MSARPISQVFSDAQEHFLNHRWALCRQRLEELFTRNYRPDIVAMYLGDVCFADGDVAASMRWHRKALSLNDGLSQALEHIIFVADAQPETTAVQANALRREWWDRFGVTAYASRTAHPNDRTPDRVLRVGYVSGDFKWHSAAFAFAAIITGHTAQITPYFYSTLEPDKYDDLTQPWAKGHPDTWRDVSSLTPPQLAQVIRKDNIDILVDLAGWSGNNRLLTFAARPAPVQIQAWGYALGSGCPATDAIFADQIVCSPEVRADLYERVIDLPTLLSYFPRPDLPGPSPLPCLEKPPVFAVFQRAIKSNPETIATWRALLERLPQARIWFQGSDYTPSVQTRVRAQLGPTADRVSFHFERQHRDHMLCYQDVDLSLDPWPQTGGVSTLDGLYMGVPTVTLLGPRMIQRTSASLLSAVGLHDFITLDRDAYVECAVQWVTARREELADIRHGLRRVLTQSPIIVGYGDRVEAAYRSLWREYCETGQIARAA